MDGWQSCQHCSIVWYVTRPNCAALHIDIQVVPNSVKKAGVCAIMSMWLAHIKDHLWTIGFMPNHRASNYSKTRLRWVMKVTCLARWVCCMKQHPCMLPRELRWEELAPPKKMVRYCRLARTNSQCTMYNIQCKVHFIVVKHHQNMFRYVLYQINKL